VVDRVNARVRRIAPDGTITTLIGGGQACEVIIGLDGNTSPGAFGETR
jgi:hypothetical protein